jgi:hypothetical protein
MLHTENRTAISRVREKTAAEKSEIISVMLLI